MKFVEEVTEENIEESYNIILAEWATGSALLKITNFTRFG